MTGFPDGHPRARGPRPAWLVPTAVLVVSLVLGALVTRAVAEGDADRRDRALSGIADRTALIIGDGANRALALLDALAVGSGVDTPRRAHDRFATLSRPALGSVLSQTGLTLRVPAARRADVERSYGLRIRTRDGADVRTQADSWVLVAAGGITGRDPLRGVDVGADPARRATITAAVRNDARRITPPLPLFDSGEAGVIAYAPVYRGGRAPATAGGRVRQATGVITGVLRPTALLDELSPELRPDVRLTITDRGAAIAARGRLDDDVAVRSVPVGGRLWRVTVSAAPPAGTAAFAAVGTGMLALLLAIVAVLVGRRDRYARRMVADRMRERDLAEAARETSEQRYRVLAENTGDMISRHHLDGTALDVSAACQSVLGVPPAAAVGTWAAEICHPDDRDAVVGAQGLAAAGAPTAVAYRVPRDGGWRWVESTLNPVVDAATGDPVEVVASTRDVHDRVSAQEALSASESRLRELAEHDAATGLLNRRAFEATLEDPAAAGRTRTLVVLDLDHFKFVNDSLGHAAGDDLLRRVADVLRRRARAGDVVARLGGDEFAVLIDGPLPAGEAVARSLAEALRELRTPMRAGGQRQVTASFGVAEMRGHAPHAAEEALVAADLSMYDAKEAGRDTWRSYRRGEETAIRMEARVGWEERVRRALSGDGFRVLYQPIVDLRTRRTTRYEALLRLGDADGDLAPPVAFLPVAERLGLMPRIDRWVIGHVVADLAAHPGTHLAVNLSPQGLSDPGLPAYVETALRQAGVDGSRLSIEVTETAALSDPGVAARVAAELDRLGVAIAIDDFGSGYATLSSLRVVPAALLKIDGEFVRGCPTSARDRHLVQSMVDLAGRLGLETVAEWVEDDDTARAMAALGVTHGQGYHFGRPGPLPEPAGHTLATGRA